MPLDVVNLGSSPTGEGGDSPREAFTKINNNVSKTVEGPSAATDGAVALFDGTTGKLLENGPVPGAANGLATLDANLLMVERPVYSTLTNPVLANVYDPFYAGGSTAAFSAFATGQTWSAVVGDTGNTIASAVHLAGGGVVFTNTGNTSTLVSQAKWLVDGYSAVLPRIYAKWVAFSPLHWVRVAFVSYVDANNWIGVSVSTASHSIIICVAGVVTTLAAMASASASHGAQNGGQIVELLVTTLNVHANRAAGNRSVVVEMGGADRQKLVANLTIDQRDAVMGGSVGMSLGSTTNVYEFTVYEGKP